MRPGQLTPENAGLVGGGARPLSSFNEAGAINPGKRPGQSDACRLLTQASMRPGQLTPENVLC